jgi:hypothetical protein
MGWTPTPQHGDASYVVNYHPVPVDATKPHRAYMIRGEQRVEHSMIGIDYPGYSLGVLTENAPLIFARNTELMRIFRGKSLFEVA